VSSALGVFTPEESILNVYVRMWTVGRETEAAEFKSDGVGATATLMTCSNPDKHTESMTCPLKKVHQESLELCVSWMGIEQFGGEMH